MNDGAGGYGEKDKDEDGNEENDAPQSETLVPNVTKPK